MALWGFVVVIVEGSLEGAAQGGKIPEVEETGNYSEPFVCG